MSETKQQPKPNPLPCGCGIKGTPYLDPIGSKGYEYKDLFIDFCPTHDAAPRLYAAAKQIEGWWLTEGKKHFYGAPAAMFSLREAIALADGNNDEVDDGPRRIPCSKCGMLTTFDPTYGDLCYRCCRADNE